jgi:hypothetical protein
VPDEGLVIETVGGVVSAVLILTVKLTTLEVELLPAASYALAVQLCVPLSALVNVQEYVYDEVASVPL